MGKDGEDAEGGVEKERVRGQHGHEVGSHEDIERED